MKRCDKRAQMKLSFGMMFSIILIIIFLAFTFFAIKTLLGMNDAVTIGKFYDSIQDDVDKIWKASLGSQEEMYSLPKKIEKVCFVDYINSNSGTGADSSLYVELDKAFWEYENMIFYPVGSGEGMDSIEIKHIDLAKMTLSDNPLCFKNVGGKVTMNIKKVHGEQLVTIN